MKYTINNETKEKLLNVKPSSKYYLTKTDEAKNYYSVITAEDGTKIKMPFKAMFFKDVSQKLTKIIAMSNSSTHCQSHELGLCQLNDPDNECYGLKIENQYKRKDIINSYESNLISGLILLTANIIYLSEYINEKAPHYIRYNKHGDFINHTQFLKFMQLVNNCPNTIFYGYTARDDILKAYNINSEFLKATALNLKINGSNKKYTNRFKVVYTFEEYIKARYVCLGNCLKCQKCFKLENKTITVLYHGSNSEIVLNTIENRNFLIKLLNALNIPVTEKDLKGGKLFNNLNKFYKKHLQTDLKEHNINNTKELVNNIILTFKDLQRSGAANIDYKTLNQIL